MGIDWTSLQKKYKGQWVALDKDEKTVLGFGKTVTEAVKKARKNNLTTPYLTKIPSKIVPYAG